VVGGLTVRLRSPCVDPDGRHAHTFPGQFGADFSITNDEADAFPERGRSFLSILKIVSLHDQARRS
jgi:hypothetical protein